MPTVCGLSLQIRLTDHVLLREKENETELKEPDMFWWDRVEVTQAFGALPIVVFEFLYNWSKHTVKTTTSCWKPLCGHQWTEYTIYVADLSNRRTAKNLTETENFEDVLKNLPNKSELPI